MAMASTSNHFFFFFLFIILSSAQNEARVSKFIHTDHNEVPQLTPSNLPRAPSPAAPPVSSVPEITPISSPAEAPAPFLDESQNAYGLYGRDSDDGERSRTITAVEEEILDGDGDEIWKSSSPDTKLQSNNFGNPRKYEQYQNNYENNNGYRNSEYENKKEYRNFEYESNFENNGERNYQYQSNYEDGGYRQRRYEPSARQGMSDTRFMENGRYFHDINSRSNGEEGESYGNKKNQYEFDSMEEYEKSEGILP